VSNEINDVAKPPFFEMLLCKPICALRDFVSIATNLCELSNYNRYTATGETFSVLLTVAANFRDFPNRRQNTCKGSALCFGHFTQFICQPVFTSWFV